jgi:hypothetical protein
MTNVSWRDAQFEYNVTIMEKTLTYTKKHRFGGIVPHGVISLTVKVANRMNNTPEAGEVRFEMNLQHASDARIERAAVKTYSSFSEPFMVIAGGIATYESITYFSNDGQSAWLQWLIILGPFFAAYLSAKWCLSMIFKHRVISINQKNGEAIALDIHGIDDASLKTLKAGLGRFIPVM